MYNLSKALNLSSIKKFLICLLVLCFTIPSLFSRDIIGVGTGTTENEARSNSINDCLSQFVIYVSEVTTVTRNTDGKTYDESTFSSSSTQTKNIDLLGASTEVRKENNGTYTATTVIPSSASVLYELRLESLYSDITNLSNLIDKGGATKDNYVRILSAMNEYTNYQTVILILDPSSQVARKPLGKSKEAVQIEYLSLLDIEDNDINITVKSLEMQRDLGLLDLDGQAELENKLKALSENKAARMEASRLLDDERKKKMTEVETSISLLTSISTVKRQTKETDDMSIVGYLSQIEAYRDTFITIKKSLNDALAENDLECTREMKEAEDLIRKQPYDPSDYFHGSLTKEAIRNRESQVEAEQKAIFEYYSKKATAIYAKYYPQLIMISEAADPLIKALSSKTFTFSNLDEGMYAYVDNYYPDAGIFSGVAILNIGEKALKLYFKIPYEEWTGDKIPAKSDIKAYNAYKINMSDWKDLFTAYPEIFTITVNITLSNTGSSKYNANFASYFITKNIDGNTDLGKVTINQVETLDYGKTADFFDYSTDFDEYIEFDLMDSMNNEVASAIVEETTQENTTVASTKLSNTTKSVKEKESVFMANTGAIGVSALVKFGQEKLPISINTDLVIFGGENLYLFGGASIDTEKISNGEPLSIEGYLGVGGKLRLLAHTYAYADVQFGFAKDSCTILSAGLFLEMKNIYIKGGYSLSVKNGEMFHGARAGFGFCPF